MLSLGVSVAAGTNRPPVHGVANHLGSIVRRGVLSFATAGDLLSGGQGGRFFSITTDAPAFRLTGTAAVTSFIAEFGEEAVLIGGLPAPAPVPLPATLPLALAAFGLMGWLRTRAGLSPARAGVSSPGLHR